MATDFKYSAFISYSHKDRKVVQGLHRALERYHLPKHLIGIETPEGLVLEKMKPFFRDRDDMAAATDLGQSIQQAMKQSKFLLVVCSPAAAKSKWVNREIQEFKKLRQGGKILCFIVAGVPNAPTSAKGDERECFPPALKEKIKGKKFEPIAADARPKGDGKHLAKLKLVSGMLGIDLDKLVQRDTQRRQRRQILAMVSSLAGVVVLTILLVLAVVARKEAEDARIYAEEKRDQAEYLVEYMLEDLTNNIAQTERLEVMGDIAMQALGYYSALDIQDVNSEILSRRAQILLTLAEIENRRGNIEQASGIFEQAFLITGELLAQDPDNIQRVFDHSQSVFWIAALDLQRGNFDRAETQFKLYADFAKRLVKMEPENLDWTFEVGYAHSNLGTLYYNQGMFAKAEIEFAEQLNIFLNLSENDPESIDLKFEVAQSRDVYADSLWGQGKLLMAQEQRMQEFEIYQNMLAVNPQNNRIKGTMLLTRQRLGMIHYFLGDAEAASNYYETGISIGEELIVFDPENTETLRKLVWLYLDYLEFINPQAGTNEAVAQVNTVKQLTERLVAKDKANPEWTLLANKALLLEARVLVDSGQVKIAMEIAEKAHKGLDALRQENPNYYGVLGQIGFAALVLADAYDMNNQPDKAILVLRQFIKITEPLESKLTLGSQDFLVRAWLRVGLVDKAKQKQSFFNNIGYVSPKLIQYWDKWGK